MRTIAELKKELDKFPDSARCWAYEGEACGIVVQSKDGKSSGFIPLNASGADQKTQLFGRK